MRTILDEPDLKIEVEHGFSETELVINGMRFSAGVFKDITKFLELGKWFSIVERTDDGSLVTHRHRDEQEEYEYEQRSLTLSYNLSNDKVGLVRRACQKKDGKSYTIYSYHIHSYEMNKKESVIHEMLLKSENNE